MVDLCPFYPLGELNLVRLLSPHGPDKGVVKGVKENK